MKALQQPVLLLTTLLSSSLVAAHPGHGLGSLGHGLQHALWNFLGLAVLAAVLLLGDQLWQRLRKIMKARV